MAEKVPSRELLDKFKRMVTAAQAKDNAGKKSGAGTDDENDKETLQESLLDRIRKTRQHIEKVST